MKPCLFVLTLFVLSIPVSGQDSLKHIGTFPDADSLWGEFSDQDQHDSIRLDALVIYSERLLNQDPEAAKMMFTELERLSRESQLPLFETKSSMLMGRYWLQKGEPSSGLPYFLKARDIARENHLRKILDNTNNGIAAAYFYMDEYEKALEFFILSMKLREESKDYHGQVESMGNIAQVLLTQQQYEDAVVYLKDALEIFDTDVDDPEARMSIKTGILIKLGNAFILLNELDEAEYYVLQALEITEKTGAGIQREGSKMVLATIYLGKKELDKALRYSESALEFFQQRNMMLRIAETNVLQGEILLEMGKFQRAISHFHEGRIICQKNGFLPRLARSNEMLYTAYRKQGRGDSAVWYLEKYISLNDSIRNDERLKELTRLQVQYDYDKKQLADSLQHVQEQAVLEEQVKRQKTQRNAFLIAFLVGLSVLGMLIYFYRQKQQSNLVLAEKNQTIQTALEERETLLKEIHHRVKNNLQVVSSLLSLQSRSLKDDRAKDALKEGQLRVQAMSLIHQNLYQEDNLVGVDLPLYLAKLTDNLLSAYQLDQHQIHIHRNIAALTLDVDLIIPLGLIINELVSNALKYAYPEKDGELYLSLQQIDQELLLEVKDHGIGLPEDVNISQSKSLGFKLVRAFAKKMKGRLEIEGKNGTRIRLWIPFHVKNHLKG